MENKMMYDKNGVSWLRLYETCHSCPKRCKWDGNHKTYSGCFRYVCEDTSCNHGSWFPDKHHIGEPAGK